MVTCPRAIDTWGLGLTSRGKIKNSDNTVMKRMKKELINVIPCNTRIRSYSVGQPEQKKASFYLVTTEDKKPPDLPIWARSGKNGTRGIASLGRD